MKKFIQSLITIALLLALSACGNAETSLEVSERTESPSLPAANEPTLTALSYEGLDVNLQKLMLGYDVSDDTAFINEVYSILDLENRKICDGPSTAAATIKLTFSGSNGDFYYEVDPNELAWTLSNGVPVEYFTLPNGSYSKISELLTDYTSEHFLPKVSIDTLSEMFEACDMLRVSGDKLEFYIDTAQITGFPEEFMFEEWRSFAPPDGEHTGRRVLVIDATTYTYEAHLYIDQQITAIKKDGAWAYFVITPEAAESMWNWYLDLSKLHTE